MPVRRIAARIIAADMIDDRDIWRATKLLVDRYGDGAGAEAAPLLARAKTFMLCSLTG